MFRNLGVVEVTATSTHCSLERHLARRFGGKSLLEWTVRQVTECQQLDGVITVADCDVSDESLACNVPSDVPIFKMPGSDALGRLNGALAKYPANAIVRVRLETPFVDPIMIDSLVATSTGYPGCDYIGYCSNSGRPVLKSPVGIFAEWCRADAIRRANQLSENDTDRGCSTQFLWSHPELFQLRFIPIPAELDRDDLRLTLCGEEDWEHAETIFEALGSEDPNWRQIVRLLDDHPSLLKRMETLNREQNKEASFR